MRRAEQTYAQWADRDLVDRLLRWASRDCPRGFDSEFIGSVVDHMDEGRPMSPRQRESLERIAQSYKVNLYKYPQ